MQYVVTIEETVTEDFEIEAESLEEAMQLAEGRYHKEDIVLCPGNIVFKKMIGNSKDGKESTGWLEF